VLELRGLCAGYDGVAVVRNIDLVVHPGEVVTLLGPNGAGKTTTLLTISGLLPALGGEILFDASPTRGLRPETLARAGLAHVPEDRSLFAGLTVRENLRLAGPTRHHEARVADALHYFPRLAVLLDRKAGLLSGGEQQMLALARALVGRPKLLMIDELSLGLAPIVVEQVLPVVRAIANDLGTGILLVEQHVPMALGVADRAAVMSRGEIAVEGSAAEIHQQAGLLAASYLGNTADTAALTD
jgi:branched-chain amino acid transport system ATP-binding protein